MTVAVDGVHPPSSPTIRALVVAGLASSVGKTTVTLALAAAYRRRGLRVRCAKVGPDFIDPGFHARATGAPSRTLDAWMLPPALLRTTFAQTGADADLVLVEGQMGLFDGLDGDSEAGSTAEVAKRLGLPVLLVVDASAQVRSAAAVVLGAERFDPEVHLAGVILNRVGGERHVNWLCAALARACATPVFGALAWADGIRLPERHLGLVTAMEGRFSPDLFERLADVAERSVDLDACLALAASTVEPSVPPTPGRPTMRLGLAQDEAFQFYYADSLDALARAGAEIVPWSPLRDPGPPDVDALYLGGGYPEVHAGRLAANRTAREAVRAFARDGRPVYAECGGLMYLAEALEDLDGAFHAMAGVLPVRVRMAPPRLTIGYREVRLAGDGPFGPAGTVLRGHEFHRSHLEPSPGRGPAPEAAYRMIDPTTGETWTEGFRQGRTLASYAHLHLGSCPGAAEAFVADCLAARAGRAP